MDILEEALMLLASVRAGLANGVRHYDQRGRLLDTDEDILQVLINDGTVTLDDTDFHRVVTAEMIFQDLLSRVPR